MRFLVVICMLNICFACSYLPEEVEVVSNIDIQETADYISLTPNNTSLKTTGLLFYPGGLVAPQAYISMLQTITLAGYQVVIVKTSANLAILSQGKATACIPKFPDVGQWVIAGHSLGGAVAAMDIHADLNQFKGLILLASFPSEQQDLSAWNGAVLSIYAENDGLATTQDIIDRQHLLPPNKTITTLGQMPSSTTSGQSLYHEIKGGNHSQFASYGEQKEDGIATISKNDQQAETVDYILSFFNANQW